MAFSTLLLLGKKNNHSKLLVNEVRDRAPCLKVLDFILLQILIGTAVNYMYVAMGCILVSKCWIFIKCIQGGLSIKKYSWNISESSDNLQKVHLPCRLKQLARSTLFIQLFDTQSNFDLILRLLYTFPGVSHPSDVMCPV